MSRPCDPVIAQIGADQRLAALYHLGFQVEQTVIGYGLDFAETFSDEDGDGPFMQTVKRNRPPREAVLSL